MFSVVGLLLYLWVYLTVWIGNFVARGQDLSGKVYKQGRSLLQLIWKGPVLVFEGSRSGLRLGLRKLKLRRTYRLPRERDQGQEEGQEEEGNNRINQSNNQYNNQVDSIMSSRFSPSSLINLRKRDQRLISCSSSHSKSVDEGDVQEKYAFQPYVFTELYTNANDVKNRKELKPRSGHRIVCDEGNFYSFGGYLESTVSLTAFEMNTPGSQELFQELWKFNVSTQTWEYLPTEGEDTPKELASHSAVMHGQYMVVFGGTGVPFGTSSSNKMSICDLRTLKWQRVATTGNPPSPQYGQAVVLDQKCFYVIGGTTGYDYSLDVHKLDLVSFEWETLFITRGEAHEPTPRYRHEVAFDGNKIFILGGGTATRAYDLTLVPTFNVKTKEWTCVETIGDPLRKRRYPSARKCQGSVQRGDDVFICGGYNSHHIFTDLWKLNLTTLQWTRMPVRMPIPVYFHSTSLTPSGCMLMFGGVTNVKSNTRTNKVFKIWLTVPSLKEMCWEALLHYQPFLKYKSRQDVLEEGIPKDLVDRLLPPRAMRELPAPPL